MDKNELLRDEKNYKFIYKDILNGLIGIALYCFIFFYLSNYIFSLTENIVKLFYDESRLTPDLLSKIDMNVGSIVNLIVYLILFILLVSLYKPEIITDIKNESINTDKLSKNILIALLIAYSMNIVSAIIRASFKYNVSVENQESITKSLGNSTLSMILLSVTVSFIGPVVEELIYRKSMFKVIRNKYVALILSSLIFGLIHVLTTDVKFKYQIILAIPYISSGLVFGYVYIKNDKNIYVPIILHSLQNSISLILLISLTSFSI